MINTPLVFSAQELDDDSIIRRWMILDWLEFIEDTETNAFFVIEVPETGERYELPIHWQQHEFDYDGLISGIAYEPDQVRLSVYLADQPDVRCDKLYYFESYDSYITPVSLNRLLEANATGRTDSLKPEFEVVKYTNRISEDTEYPTCTYRISEDTGRLTCTTHDLDSETVEEFDMTDPDDESNELEIYQLLLSQQQDD